MANVNLNVILALVDKMRPGLQSAETGLRSFREKASAAGDEFQGKWGALADTSRQVGTTMSVAGGAIVAGLGAASRAAADYGGTIWDMHTRTGAGVESLQALKYVAEQTGSDLGNVELGLKRMAVGAKDAANGSGEAAAAYKQLGVNVRGSNGEIKPAEQLFTEVGMALRNVQSDTDRAAIAVTLFGRAGTRLLPMFLDNKKNIKELSQEARDLGLILGEDAISKADDFGDTLDRIKNVVSNTFIRIGVIAIPMLQGMCDWLVNTMSAFNKFSAAHPSLARGLIYVAGAAGLVLSALGPMLYILPSVIQMYRGLQLATQFVAGGGLAQLPGILARCVLGMKAFSAASWSFLISPAGIVTVAIAGLLVELAYLFKAYEKMSSAIAKAKADLAQEKAYEAQANSRGLVTFDSTARTLGYSEKQIERGLGMEDARKVAAEMKRLRDAQKAAGTTTGGGNLLGMQSGSGEVEADAAGAQQRIGRAQELLSQGATGAALVRSDQYAAATAYGRPLEVTVNAPTYLDGQTIANNQHVVRMADNRAAQSQSRAYRQGLYGAAGRE